MTFKGLQCSIQHSLELIRESDITLQLKSEKAALIHWCEIIDVQSLCLEIQKPLKTEAFDF
jgi:hypothetical protein